MTLRCQQFGVTFELVTQGASVLYPTSSFSQLLSHIFLYFLKQRELASWESCEMNKIQCSIKQILNQLPWSGSFLVGLIIVTITNFQRNKIESKYHFRDRIEFSYSQIPKASQAGSCRTKLITMNYLVDMQTDQAVRISS